VVCGGKDSFVPHRAQTPVVEIEHLLNRKGNPTQKGTPARLFRSNKNSGKPKLRKPKERGKGY